MSRCRKNKIDHMHIIVAETVTNTERRGINIDGWSPSHAKCLVELDPFKIESEINCLILGKNYFWWFMQLCCFKCIIIIEFKHLSIVALFIWNFWPTHMHMHLFKSKHKTIKPQQWLPHSISLSFFLTHFIYIHT